MSKPCPRLTSREQGFAIFSCDGLWVSSLHITLAIAYDNASVVLAYWLSVDVVCATVFLLPYRLQFIYACSLNKAYIEFVDITVGARDSDTQYLITRHEFYIARSLLHLEVVPRVVTRLGYG